MNCFHYVIIHKNTLSSCVVQYFFIIVAPTCLSKLYSKTHTCAQSLKYSPTLNMIHVCCCCPPPSCHFKIVWFEVIDNEILVLLTLRLSLEIRTLTIELKLNVPHSKPNKLKKKKFENKKKTTMKWSPRFTDYRDIQTYSTPIRKMDFELLLVNKYRIRKLCFTNKKAKNKLNRLSFVFT